MAWDELCATSRESRSTAAELSPHSFFQVDLRTVWCLPTRTPKLSTKLHKMGLSKVKKKSACSPLWITHRFRKYSSLRVRTRSSPHVGSFLVSWSWKFCTARKLRDLKSQFLFSLACRWVYVWLQFASMLSSLGAVVVTLCRYCVASLTPW